MPRLPFSPDSLWESGFQTIRELETDHGILASSQQELYGCIFGRDSLITSLKLLAAYQTMPDPYFLALVKKVLTNLAELQGRTVNIESGEEPGKCIHEYRPTNHDHLTKLPDKPWYVYPDNVMRNYDTVDATPLFLIAVFRYWQLSRDEDWFRALLPAAERALHWLTAYGDSNGDGFIDYQLHPERNSGGLQTQSWMDSVESVFHEDGQPITYPVAPVEVQGYAYLALTVWARYFELNHSPKATVLLKRAERLRRKFNEEFVLSQPDGPFIASALDGTGRPVMAHRSSVGHLLWSARQESLDGITDCVLDNHFIPDAVRQLLSPELFSPQAGIRTLATNSAHFSANSYHNGSIWPHDNGMIAEGFDHFGYTTEARNVRIAVLQSFHYFRTPIELYVYDENKYDHYCSPRGQTACTKQAWSAATMLAESAAIRNVAPHSLASVR